MLAVSRVGGGRAAFAVAEATREEAVARGGASDGRLPPSSPRETIGPSRSARRSMRRATTRRRTPPARDDAGRLLARTGEAARLDHAAEPGRRLVVRRGATSASAGSPTACSTPAPIASTGISPSAATPLALIWEPDDPAEEPRRFTYRELHAEVCRFANVLKARGRRQGRPRHPLHADDPRGGVRAARLRADRRDPFGGVRRLLARGARRPDRGLRLANRRHRRRGPSRRQARAAQGQCRRRRRACADARARHRRPRDRRRRADARARPLVPRGGRRRRHATARPSRWRRRTRCSSSTPRGSTGKPKGVLHTTARLPALGGLHPRALLRLPPRRRLVVRRRHRLGHRAQLHPLRPARQRRDDADVRRAAELARRRRASGRSSTATRSTPSSPPRPRSAR